MRCSRVVRVDHDRPDDDALEAAAVVLRRGGLVAFATETVYGLGADATQAAAVAKIFAAKGRPQTNPLIAHVSDAEMAKAWAGSWPDAARRAAEALWPGPLTLVVERGEGIDPAVSAGLSTVGLRVPASAVARGVIAALGRPVAAPSANRSEHISPTTARHVVDDLDGRVDVVLDSGPTGVGIESTVVDVTGPFPRLLRRGPISQSALETVLGCTVEAEDVQLEDDASRSSPGQSARHYAPDVPTVRYERSDPLHLEEHDAVLCIGGSVAGDVRVQMMLVLAEPLEAARRLYATLRTMESAAPGRIVVVMPPQTTEWLAVRDRLLRASVPA